MNTCYSSLLSSLLILSHHAPAFAGLFPLPSMLFFCYIFLANFSGLNLNDPTTEKTSLTLHTPPYSLYCMFLFQMLSHRTLLFSPFMILHLLGWLFNAVFYHTVRAGTVSVWFSSASPAPSNVPGIWMLMVVQ